MTAATGLTRRRFLAVAGAAGLGVAGLGFGTSARSAPVTWRGTALGAQAELRIAGVSRARALKTIDHCLGEIARLEKLFSLYRSDSAIAHLNRARHLENPDPDFLALLSTCRGLHTASNGAFDPAIQPQWARLARKHADMPAGVPATFGGFDDIDFGPAHVSFARPNMAVTFNGIAQGYITDRVVDILQNENLPHTLVDVGELRALGPREDGRPWRTRIDGTHVTLGLDDKAVATSATSGTTFDAGGSHGHILDPATGISSPAGRQVSVVAPTATLADGLSTALCVLPQRDHASVLTKFKDTAIASLKGW